MIIEVTILCYGSSCNPEEKRQNDKTFLQRRSSSHKIRVSCVTVNCNFRKTFTVSPQATVVDGLKFPVVITVSLHPCNTLHTTWACPGDLLRAQGQEQT